MARADIAVIDDEPQLIAVYVAMFGAEREPATGGDRHLKNAAVAVMNATTGGGSMRVLAVVVIMLARPKPGERIEKTGEAWATGGNPDRFMAIAALNHRIGLLIGRAYAGRQPDRLFERARRSRTRVHQGIGVKYHPHGG